MYLVKCDIDTGLPLRDSNGHCIPVKIGKALSFTCIYQGLHISVNKILVGQMIPHVNGKLCFNFNIMDRAQLFKALLA